MDFYTWKLITIKYTKKIMTRLVNPSGRRCRPFQIYGHDKVWPPMKIHLEHHDGNEEIQMEARGYLLKFIK